MYMKIHPCLVQENIQYLKSLLKLDPSRLIQHLQISNTNYTATWELLEKRYKNTRLILSKILDTILNISVVQCAIAEKLNQLHHTTTESLEAVKKIQGLTQKTGDPQSAELLFVNGIEKPINSMNNHFNTLTECNISYN